MSVDLSVDRTWQVRTLGPVVLLMALAAPILAAGEPTVLSSTREEIHFSLDLGEPRAVRTVSAVCLHAGGRIIYSPERVVVEISRDDRRWQTAGASAFRLPPEVMARTLRTYRVTLPEVMEARYVRLRLVQRQQLPPWPWYPEQEPWLFLGQVVVE